MTVFEYETFNLEAVRKRATQAIAAVTDEPFHCSDSDMEKVLALVNVLQDFNTLISHSVANTDEPPRTCQSACCGNVLYGTECYDNAGYCDVCISKWS